MTMETHRRWSLLRLFWRYFRKVSGRLMLAGLCTIGGAAIDLLKAWPLKIIIDQVLLSHPLPPALGFLQPIMTTFSASQVLFLAAGSIVAISALGAVLSYAEVYVTTSLGYDVVYTLRRELFAHLQRLSLSFHNRAKSGDLLYRMASETSAIRDLLTDSVLKLSEYFLTVVGACFVIFAMDRNLGLIAVVVMPFLGLSLAQVYRTTKRTAKLQKRKESLIASRVNEVLGAIPLVQAFSREKYEEARYDAATEETKSAGIRIARLEAAASRTTQIVVAIGIAATVLYGAHQVLNGLLTPGDLVLIVSYVKDMWKPIKRMARTAGDLSKGLASAERIAEILDVEPEIKDRPDAIDVRRLRGDIEFRDVSFDYGDGKGALRGVSFSVKAGERLALVGISGAGKSTIVSLLLRLYDPQQGAVLVDGIDIRRYRRESYRREIGLVLQQSVLFGATVRENIAYGRPDATNEQIVAAAKAANAHEFIRGLRQGYDTVIGERGATLSGGQRQRIALARALVRGASILVLDEPMTALDAENEQAVREALDGLMKGRTSVHITHDLPAVVTSDRVVLLEGGRVLDHGTHVGLLARSRRYRELYGLDTGAAGGNGHPAPATRSAASSRRETGFPVHPELPQLEAAADPERMLKVFREHLEPANGTKYDLRACEPVRFRCRQSSGRCVMQYRLRVVDRESGRERFPWVTGVLYTRFGEAERLWKELNDDDPWQGIPEDWRLFKPVGYVRDLSMLLQVFPYDRRLRNLAPVMGGALNGLGLQLVPPERRDGCRVLSESIKPARYRTEMGAALEYNAVAGFGRGWPTEKLRCYLKVYRNGGGEETARLLRLLDQRAEARQLPYSVVRPVAHFPKWRTLVLEEAPGRSLQNTLLSGGDPAAAGWAVARAIAAFNTDEGPTLKPHPHEAQLAEVERTGALVSWAIPGTAKDVRAITEAVSRLPEAPPAPIHRDLKPDHVFISDDLVTFIDLDSVAAGDPVRDPAHLYAHLVSRVGMDSVPDHAARAAAEAFAHTYFDTVPKGWRERFPVHCAGAFLEVAAGAFKRQELGWRDKAQAALKAAHEALSGRTR